MSATLDPQKERFAELVASGTSLDLGVVRAWVLAEGGPVDNPLNIKGNGPVRRYGSADAAAAATIANLRTPTYAHVLEAARSGNVQSQLHAIVVSPWDAGHYRNGTLLAGTYARVTAAGDTTTKNPGDPTLAAWYDPRDWHVPDLNPLDNVASWLQNKAATGFLYAAFTVASGALVFVGLASALGRSPGELVAGAASVTPSGRAAKAAAIPF